MQPGARGAHAHSPFHTNNAPPMHTAPSPLSAEIIAASASAGAAMSSQASAWSLAGAPPALPAGGAPLPPSFSGILPTVRELLTDALSGELLEDATMVSCGHSFGGASLAQLRLQGVCPICHARLDASNCRPNLSLRAVAAAFAREGAVLSDGAPLGHHSLLSGTPPPFAFSHMGRGVPLASAGSPSASPCASPSGLLRAERGASAAPPSPKLSSGARGSSTTAFPRSAPHKRPPTPGGSGGAEEVRSRPASAPSAHFPFRVGDVVIIRGNKRTPIHFIGRRAVITTQCLNGWYMVRTLEGTTEEVRLQYRSLERVSCAPVLPFGSTARPGSGPSPAAVGGGGTLRGGPGAPEEGPAGALGRQRAPSPTQWPGPGSVKGSPSVRQKAAAGARASQRAGPGQERDAGTSVGASPSAGAGTVREGSASRGRGPLPSLPPGPALPLSQWYTSSPVRLKGQTPEPNGSAAREEAGSAGTGPVRELLFGPEDGPGGSSLSSHSSGLGSALPPAPEAAQQRSVGVSSAGAGSGDWALPPSMEQPPGRSGSATAMGTFRGPAQVISLPHLLEAGSRNPSARGATDLGTTGPGAPPGSRAQKPGASLRMRLQGVAEGASQQGSSRGALLGRSHADATPAAAVPTTHSPPEEARGSKRPAASALGPLDEVPCGHRGVDARGSLPLAGGPGEYQGLGEYQGAGEYQALEHNSSPAQSLSASFHYDMGADSACLPCPGDSLGLLANQGPGLLTNQGTGLLTSLAGSHMGEYTGAEYTGAEFLQSPGAAWLVAPKQEEWQQGPAPPHSSSEHLEASSLGAPVGLGPPLDAWPPDDGGSLGPPGPSGREEELLGESLVESGNGSALLSKAAARRAVHAPTRWDRAASPAPRTSAPSSPPYPTTLGHGQWYPREAPALPLGGSFTPDHNALRAGSASRILQLVPLLGGFRPTALTGKATVDPTGDVLRAASCRADSVHGSMAPALLPHLSPDPSREAPAAVCCF